MGRLGWVAQGLVPVDDAVEMAGRADPGVDRLAVGLALGAGVVIGRPAVGQDGRADDLDAPVVGAVDHLAIAGDDLGDEGLVGFRRGGRIAGQHAQVVDAFQQHHVGHAGLGEHVALEPRQGVGTQAVEQHTVAADAQVQQADVLALQPFQQTVGPAQVGVGLDAVAVGDAVAQRHDGPRLRRNDVDAGDLEPAVGGLGAGQVGGGHVVARQDVGRGARARVAGLDAGHLGIVQADGQVGQRRDRQCHRIGPVVGAGGDGHLRAAREGEGAIGGRIDAGGGEIGRHRDMGGLDGQRGGPERVGQPHPQGLAGQGQAHDLAQGGVGIVFGGDAILVVRRDLGAGPGADPAMGISMGRQGQGQGGPEHGQPREHLHRRFSPLRPYRIGSGNIGMA